GAAFESPWSERDLRQAGATIRAFAMQSPSDHSFAPDTPQAVLSQVFGYSAFRGPQAEIVEQLAAGGDALVLMPTGGGKS
ncbi:hypothetical protein Q6326_31520, partial [Klebsiella pneumoniae]|nr:hypothetical protein [Klebsiella pneumoniae]